MFGGPFVNLLLAVFCFAIVWIGIGMPVLSNKVGVISPCMNPQMTECSSAQETPAMKSELRKADEILTWDGENVSDWQQLQKAINEHGIGLKTVEVMRGGKIETLTIEVIEVERQKVQDGVFVTDAQGKPVTAPQPYVGISPEIIRERQNPVYLPAQIGNLLLGTAKIVISLPVQLWNIGVSLFSDTPRDQTGVVGLVGIAQIAGNITSADVNQYPFASRLADMLLLFASLNMSLFVFNLIPLLPLDGGHILGAIIEWCQKLAAKRRGKENPGAFDTARLLPLSQTVILFLLQ
ncbi:M50 family metallopeptidase [Arcanobacterium hippocoleae]